MVPRLWEYEPSTDERLTLVRQNHAFGQVLSSEDIAFLFDFIDGKYKRAAHRPKAKPNRGRDMEIMFAVHRELQAGKSEKAAVSIVAEEFKTSESTIRRAVRTSKSIASAVFESARKRWRSS